MTLRNARPRRFSPQGLSDALAEEDAFPGACSTLQNLIPDPTTKNLWTPRPASIEQTSAFTGFTAPTGVSVFKIVGSYVFGLVSTALTAGYDQPFCFNLATSSFVTVTGVTASNVPLTQPTTGDWTPPTMDVMGTFVIVTHPGFDGVTNFIGWFDISVLTAPVWHAGNFTLINTINTITLTSGGSGYTNGTYTNVPLTGGQGSGATANITVAGGAVTAVTIVNPGLFYAVGNTLSVGNTLGSGGVGLVITINTVNGAGIQNITLINGGSGYTNGTYTGIAFGGGSGTGATGNFVVSGGVVTSVVPDVGGSGYLAGDFIMASGVITGITFAAGSGYTNGVYDNIPLIAGSGPGTGATFNITVSGGTVTKVVINKGGSGYAVSNNLTLEEGSVSSPSGLTGVGFGSGLTDGTYNGVTQLSTTGGGTGIVLSIIVSGGIIFNTNVTYGGIGYAVGDTIYVSGANLGNAASSVISNTVSTIVPLIGNGSGFSATVSAVSAGSLGAGGSGFLGEVLTTTPEEGFINFTTIPSWVRQFNGRAWFGINPSTGIPSVIFTDVYALNCTNANQALSFGDNTPLTAAAPLGLANLLGGVVQSLIIFKSLNGIIQVTGDALTDNLEVNQVPGGSGTLSPRSVVEHPQGLLYLDHDGWRMVTLDGNCTDPIGIAGQGVVVPFVNPITRTRVAAGCDGSILRASVNTAAFGWREYWFDTVRKVWSGPHTFPSTCMDVYEGAFVLAAQSAPIGLWESSPIPTSTSVFIENGVQLAWIYETVTLMDNMTMAQSEIAELQVKTTAPLGMTSITVAALEVGGETGSTAPTAINTAVYTYSAVGALGAKRIDFNVPVVYNRLAIEITGLSFAGFQIGDIFAREREEGYQTAFPHP